MMLHANVPKYFWVEAFKTAVFFINRLYTTILHWESPFHMQYNKQPDYGSLRVFGSRCYPYVQDQKNNKFDPKSLPCVFLGYSDRHKGYRCYYQPTKRTFISRHVTFDEENMHFKNQYPNKTITDCMVTTFTKWDSLTVSIHTHSTPSQEKSTPDAPLKKSLTLFDLVCDAESQTKNHLSSPFDVIAPLTQLEDQTAPKVPPQSNDAQDQFILLAPFHNMQTRSKSGVHKPNPKYALLHQYDAIPKPPKTIKVAIQHLGWKQAMEELQALNQNGTWSLVPRQETMNVVGSRWVLTPKINPDGSLQRLKARLVAKCYHQVNGIDFIETYSPVVKPATIRLILSVSVIKRWNIRQLDVRNV